MLNLFRMGLPATGSGPSFGESQSDESDAFLESSYWEKLMLYLLFVEGNPERAAKALDQYLKYGLPLPVYGVEKEPRPFGAMNRRQTGLGCGRTGKIHCGENLSGGTPGLLDGYCGNSCFLFN